MGEKKESWGKKLYRLHIEACVKCVDIMIARRKEKEMNCLRGQRTYYPETVDGIKLHQEMVDDDQYKLSEEEKERWGITDDLEEKYQAIRNMTRKKKGKWEL